VEAPETIVIEIPTPFAGEVRRFMLDKQSPPLVTLPGRLGRRGDLRRLHWYGAQVRFAPAVSGAEQDGSPTVRAELNPFYAKLVCEAAYEVRKALLTHEAR
jgi:hypothetical protein